MTDKELHKLGRRELLQLLLQQGREAEEIRLQLTETEEQLRQLEENYERLRKRLDQKDEQIHQLRDTLEDERTKREIKLEEAGSIAEAALRLNGVFEAAQSAADQYLHNIKLLNGSDNIELSFNPREVFDPRIEAAVKEAAKEPVEGPKTKLEVAEEPASAEAAETAAEEFMEEPEPVSEVMEEPAAETVREPEALKPPVKPLLATEMYRIRKKDQEQEESQESEELKEIEEPIETAMLLKRQQGWRTISQPTGKPPELGNGIFHSQAGLRRVSF